MTNNQKYVLYASNASVNATFLPYESSYSLNYNGPGASAVVLLYGGSSITPSSDWGSGVYVAQLPSYQLRGHDTQSLNFRMAIPSTSAKSSLRQAWPASPLGGGQEGRIADRAADDAEFSKPANSACLLSDISRRSRKRGARGERAHRRQRVVAPFRMGAYARPFPPAGLNAEPGAHPIEARWRMALSRRPSSIATQPSRP